MPGPSLPECNCATLRAAARYVSQAYDLALAQSGLRTTQYSILSHLRRLGPMTINALAAELVMDRTTLGRNVLPLQRDGLISVARGEADGRVRRLELTRAGRAQVGRADAGWAAAQRSFEEAMGKKRSARLRKLLAEIVASGLVSEPAAGADER